MAPGLVETPSHRDESAEKAWAKDKSQTAYKEAFAQGAKTTNYKGELEGVQGHAPAKYPNYLPEWDDVKYPPYEPFEAYEHGKDGDPSFPDLLAGAEVVDLTANIGAEVKGVQLSKLTDAGKDQLALLYVFATLHVTCPD